MSKLDELERLANAANRDIEGSMVIDPQTIKSLLAERREMIALIRQCKNALGYLQVTSERYVDASVAGEALSAIEVWEKE